MNADELLAQIRADIVRVTHGPDLEPEEEVPAAARIIGAVVALDAHLSAGGALPAAWEPADVAQCGIFGHERDADGRCEACGQP